MTLSSLIHRLTEIHARRGDLPVSATDGMALLDFAVLDLADEVLVDLTASINDDPRDQTRELSDKELDSMSSGI
jgi:hypothetical protein